MEQGTENEPGRNISINDNRLNRVQKLHAIWVTNLIPTIGFVSLLLLIYVWGFSWKPVLLMIFMYILTVIGLEVGFHRFFTHQSFQTGPFLKTFLAIAGSMCAQGPLIYWVANHRRHHKHSDSDGDPHSPYVYDGKKMSHVKGLLHAHYNWQVYHETPNTAYFAKDLLKDRILWALNKYYFLWVILGLAFPALIGLFWIGGAKGLVLGFLWGGLGRIFVVNQITFSINSFCHVYGNQPFDTKEGSRNNFWLAIPTFGQAWHNNHHAFPHSAIVGFNPFQIDLAGYCIILLEKTGLVSEIKRPNQFQIHAKETKGKLVL